jgi:hypothetical protein
MATASKAVQARAQALVRFFALLPQNAACAFFASATMPRSQAINLNGEQSSKHGAKFTHSLQALSAN